MRVHEVTMLDLVGTKKMPPVDRQHVQLLLKAVLGFVNIRYRTSLPRSWEFSAGDCAEAIFLPHDHDNVVHCLAVIKRLLWRVQLRVSSSVGVWNIVTDGGINEQDGPVFWAAKDELRAAKGENVRVRVRKAVYRDDEFSGTVPDTESCFRLEADFDNVDGMTLEESNNDFERIFDSVIGLNRQLADVLNQSKEVVRLARQAAFGTDGNYWRSARV